MLQKDVETPKIKKKYWRPTLTNEAKQYEYELRKNNKLKRCEKVYKFTNIFLIGISDF